MTLIRFPVRDVERTVVRLKVNGAERELAVRPHDVLLDVLREDLGLAGTKRGCDMGTCGCCTVHLDGVPALSCMVLALQAEGREVTTVEGLRDDATLHPVQECFATYGGSQCGFCTPGFVMTTAAFLEENDDPSDEEVREAIGGNMCRCTGYAKIVEAVREAAALRREARQKAS